MSWFSKAAFVCPLCFDERPWGDLLFRCAQLHRCPGGAPTFQVPVESGGARPVVQEAFCPAEGCRRPTKVRLCPSCHGLLPGELGICTSLTLGLLGAKFTGKSHYVGVLIERIKKRLAIPGNAFNCSFRLEGDASRERYEKGFERFLFRDRSTIPETIAGGADASVRVPVAGKLRFSGNLSFFQKLFRWRWGNTLEPLRDVQMSFFDTAGEDLAGADIMGAECRYLGNSQGLILLLDPLQIPQLQEELVRTGQLPPHRIPPKGPAPWKLLDALIEVLQRLKKHGGPRIKIPLAVAFSKCDELDQIMHPGHPARPSAEGMLEDENTGNADGRFDCVAHNRVQDIAARVLLQYGCGDMLNNLRDHFDHYSLFFVSSLGHAPEPDGRLKELRPRRMLDPFLWLLAVHKVIPRVGNLRNPDF